ncbi:hypothetical protein AYI68_g2242 [Smittium mucronatum]|uniref:DUF4440 domain-containing protein n=1 Tax=Smittium mucronatum TaxID=133383 RepID=A0A1R0H3A7_9FUNG|nr:hypothetical protein AYI68_g2242 [Smittium mucronatum]
MSKVPLVPPFNLETAKLRAKVGQNIWNSLDYEQIYPAYTADSVWRNRDRIVIGTEEIIKFIKEKFAKEKGYQVRKELFAYTDNKIAVQFWYEFHDETGQWYRTIGIDAWTFAENGQVSKRQMSCNDVKISESDRWFKDGVDVDTVHIPAEYW